MTVCLGVLARVPCRIEEVARDDSGSVGDVNPESILTIFDELVSDVAEALSELEDWGHSGNRADQYNHDVVADDMIVPRLLAEGFRVLTEESGITEGQEAEPASDITIVVDPVDGSTNASRGLPWYAISLCAVDGDGPLVSHVANLAIGDRFRAIRGEGVETHRGEIRPSGCKDLGDAMLAFSGWPPEHGGWRQYRTYGASALDICAVASGVFDGFMDVNAGHGVWDYLGAGLVCAEVGIELVDGDGQNPVVLDHTQRRAPLVAATPELQAQMIDMRQRWVDGTQNRS